MYVDAVQCGMQRNVIFAEDEYYHLYNRGVEKRKIFLDERDYQRFIKLLYVANNEASFVYRDIERKSLSDIPRTPLVALGAYVLMPNHFHLLVKEIKEGGISMFMEKLLTGYASYFNKRHKRVGALFQGTFQAEHLDTDRYLKYIYSYIHLNPIKLIDSEWKENGVRDKRRAKEFLASFTYSSYFDLYGHEREEKLILSREQFPDYFSEKSDFSAHIEDWLDYHDENSTT